MGTNSYNYNTLKQSGIRTQKKLTTHHFGGHDIDFDS